MPFGVLFQQLNPWWYWYQGSLSFTCNSQRNIQKFQKEKKNLELDIGIEADITSSVTAVKQVIFNFDFVS